MVFSSSFIAQYMDVIVDAMCVFVFLYGLFGLNPYKICVRTRENEKKKTKLDLGIENETNVNTEFVKFGIFFHVPCIYSIK